MPKKPTQKQARRNKRKAKKNAPRIPKQPATLSKLGCFGLLAAFTGAGCATSMARSPMEMLAIGCGLLGTFCLVKAVH